MGQTRGQKAAKAAGAQQPKKKWPGKAQREAVQRSRAAKKKTGGGKPAGVKKAVSLPRGAVRAVCRGTCPACLKDYDKGVVIMKVSEGWGHLACAPRKMSAAEREFARNKAAIESGETFRSRKPSDWRLGSSPSSTRPAR
ncbi:hypothetical protein [Streptomyces syringium]|uniref:hypothetical protein n=1 Tax=Streptomyces syringium TaxID=76729 RepID=UPI0033E85F86